MKTHYLRWFKTRPRARFDLSASGVAGVTPEELDVAAVSVPLEVTGHYGHESLIICVAKLYSVQPSGIVLVPGTSSANVIALAVAANRGDRVLLEHPGYDPLFRAADFLGLRVSRFERRGGGGFAVQHADLDKGLRNGAKAVVLSNLHNPGGCWLSPEDVLRLAEHCAGFDATLIVDEVYLDAAHLAGRGPRWSAAGLAENAIGTGSLTKVYGLGGLRVGWILTTSQVAERARDVMDVLSVENAAPSAALALHAFSNLDALERRFRDTHRRGCAVYRNWQATTPTISGYENYGALFEWIRLPEGMRAEQLADLLVTEFDTLVVPGEFFGASDHIRINIGLPESALAEGLSRVSAGIDRLLNDAGAPSWPQSSSRT